MSYMAAARRVICGHQTRYKGQSKITASFFIWDKLLLLLEWVVFVKYILVWNQYKCKRHNYLYPMLDCSSATTFCNVTQALPLHTVILTFWNKYNYFHRGNRQKVEEVNNKVYFGISDEQGIGRSQFRIFGFRCHKRVTWTTKSYFNDIGKQAQRRQGCLLITKIYSLYEFYCNTYSLFDIKRCFLLKSDNISNFRMNCNTPLIEVLWNTLYT